MHPTIPCKPSAAIATPPDIRTAFETGAAKNLRHLPELAASARTWAFAQAGDYINWNEGFHEIGNWTTGFFTGIGILGWLHDRNPQHLEAVKQLDLLFRKKVHEGAADTMHDLGFLYSPYAVALYQVTGEETYKELGLRAAELLYGRFITPGGYIRAWGRMDEIGTKFDGLAIIDCLMNLPLLHWASRVTGDPKFHNAAVSHSDAALRHFVRPDGSVYHSFRFHPDGTPNMADNFCGRAIESHWARGATWAMYGFSLAYQHTGDERYLEAALRITRCWISQLDEEIIPLWDFRLPDGEAPIRDSSAAAIAACAIQHLDSQGHADGNMLDTKDALIQCLCSNTYLDSDPSVQGLLRHAQVGNGTGKARSAYTSWGDYFFLEALGRELGLPVSWW